MNNLTDISDDELNAKYESGERRLINEINRIKIPAFIEALKKPGYLNQRHLSQIRTTWDSERQSRLIESFITNIPVPPMVFYQKGYQSYELIDGQERIRSLQAFYNNHLWLSGIEIWPEINGYTYAELPWKVRRILDNRSICYIVIIPQVELTYSQELQIKQLSFERLNTSRTDLDPL